MSPLFYLLIALLAIFTLCIGASMALNRKAMYMLIQLRVDLIAAGLELDKKNISGEVTNVKEMEDSILEFESRFEKIETIHKHSRLSLNLAGGLFVAAMAVLIIFVVFSN